MDSSRRKRRSGRTSELSFGTQAARIAQGSLESLGELEMRANAFSQQQEESAATQRRLQQLKEKYARLKARRDQLTLKLATKPKMVVGTIIANAEDGITDSQEDVLQVMKRRKLEELITAYRLTGVTVHTVRDRVQLCFDTTYNGDYFEPYHIELQRHREKLSVSKHTVPHFVPLDQLTSAHLNTNLREFTSRVMDYLNAYVARRSEILKIKKEYIEDLVDGQVHTSHAFDYVQFLTTLPRVDDGQVEFKLAYDNVCSAKPTRVSLQVVGDAALDETTREALKTYKQCMKSRPLSEAFKFIKHGGQLRDLDTRNTLPTENTA